MKIGKGKKVKSESEQVNLMDFSYEEPPKDTNRQVYQNIISKRIFGQAEETLEVSDSLIKSVEAINLEMEKHSEHIAKTVDVSSEVGAFSEEVNAGVDETMKIIEDTLNKAKVGQASVDNVVDSIDTIQATVENMKNVIVELSEKYKKINGIVDTIKGVAKTTHLLSLNANIEAARAGESGKGFAVVAGEVKKLAESSSKSADEISNIISEVTKVTDNTFNIIIEGTEKVAESTNVAEKAGEAISEMMDSVEKTRSIANQISTAVKQQTDKNQYMISVIDEMVQVAERVKSFNENISVNADRQKAALNNLRQTIGNLNELSIVDNIKQIGEKTTFTMSTAIFKTLDPAMVTDINNSNVVAPMHLGLVQFGPDTEVIGAIAKSWHLESDNVTWSFNLRRDMKFHNGRNIAAKDVKISFERLLSSKLDSPNRWFLSMIKGAEDFYNGRTNEVSGIIINGDYSLKIVLEYPYSSFINNLAHCSCSILPKEQFDNLETRPIGAGPFKFEKFDKEKNEIVLEKFKEYAIGEALIDKIRIIFDIEDTFEYFENGELDYLLVNASNVDKVKQKKYNIDIAQCIGLRFLAFNYRSSNPIIHSKEARQAINYCIDRDRVMKEALGGFETISRGAFPSSILNNSKLTGYNRNLAKAKELMKKSGIHSGTLTLQISNAGGKAGFQSLLSEILKENLKDIGIEVKVLEVSSSKFYDEESLRKSDIFPYGWIGDSGTADNFIEPLIDINNTSNRSKYNNPELMELLEEARKTRNPYKYRELLCEIEDLIIEDAAWAPLSNICVSYAYKDNIKGLRVHPLNIIKFADMWKE